jgi:disulfide bond formation protein DsbB
VLDKIISLSQSIWYWILLIIVGITSEGIALFYQYALDVRPCVLCIHTRIWILGLIIVASLALLIRHSGKLLVVAHALTTLIVAGLLERSYQLLGTERGWVFGSCDFDLGLPKWLALEEWFPSMFKVWEACGYTPELLFGITMAEALLVMSASMVLISIVLTVTAFVGRRSVT